VKDVTTSDPGDGDGGLALGDSHGLHLLDPLTGEEIARWEAPAYQLRGKLFLTPEGLSATVLAYSPGGALLAAVSQAGLHVVHGERSRVIVGGARDPRPRLLSGRGPDRRLDRRAGAGFLRGRAMRGRGAAACWLE